MTGGDGGSHALSMKSIEIIDENGSHSNKSTELPWEFYNHCSIKLNQTHAMLTGGYYNPSKTLIVNLNNFETTGGPNFNVSNRESHACSKISHPNGTNYIIVAGGSGSKYGATVTVDYEYNESTEILDVDNINRGWYQGKTKVI